MNSRNFQISSPGLIDLITNTDDPPKVGELGPSEQLGIQAALRTQHSPEVRLGYLITNSGSKGR